MVLPDDGHLKLRQSVEVIVGLETTGQAGIVAVPVELGRYFITNSLQVPSLRVPYSHSVTWHSPHSPQWQEEQVRVWVPV